MAQHRHSTHPHRQGRKMRSRTIQEGGLRKTMAHPNNPLENKPRLRILNEAYAEHMQIANRLNAIAIPNGK